MATGAWGAGARVDCRRAASTNWSSMFPNPLPDWLASTPPKCSSKRGKERKMAKWGMVIDLEKCAGCQACTVACGMENNRLPGEHWQDVIFFSEGEYPHTQLKWFPRPCMHCENPSCVAVCPTWKAPQEDWKHGVGVQPHDVVSKCNFCYHRVSKAPKGTADFDPNDPKMREFTPAC